MVILVQVCPGHSTTHTLILIIIFIRFLADTILLKDNIIVVLQAVNIVLMFHYALIFRKFQTSELWIAIAIIYLIAAYDIHVVLIGAQHKSTTFV